MSNVSKAPQKQRRCFGASYSVLLRFIHPAKLVYDRYPKKYKCDAPGGLIITQRDILRVARREQLCIFMKYKYFGDHALRYIQKWVIFII